MSNEEGILIIDNVDADENAGVYTCLVSNPSGESARRSFELFVLVPPVLEEFSFGSNLQEGQNAQTTCSIRIGDTPIFFTWRKDGYPIPASLKVYKTPILIFFFFLKNSDNNLNFFTDRRTQFGII